MSNIPRGISIMEAYQWYRQGKLFVNRRYQRKLVWTLLEKKALVDSTLAGFPIPLILLAELGPERFEIIDGTQRLNALFGFVEDQFPVEIGGTALYFDVNHFPFAKGLTERSVFEPVARSGNSFLEQDRATSYLGYQLPVTTYVPAKEGDITETFRRINSFGRQLSDQEVRQAGVTATLAELVREMGAGIRGDVSRTTVPLADMPEISIDSRRSRFGYGVHAEETFWCRQGILNAAQLRESADEQLIADMVLSIALLSPFPASKEKFDSYYGKGEPDESAKAEAALKTYGAENVKHDVISVVSAIKDLS